VRRLLLEHQIRPVQSDGAKFFWSTERCWRKSFRAAELQPDDGAFEVGTGFGTLTAVLATRCRQVVSLEKDKRLADIARKLLSPFPNIVVHQTDALTAHWSELLNAHPVTRWKFVANLPYAISKPLLMRLLRERHLFADATVTVQREVAQRMVAQAGQDNYSILSVAVQLYADARIIATVPPTSFYPEPRSLVGGREVDFLASAQISRRRRTVLFPRGGGGAGASAQNGCQRLASSVGHPEGTSQPNFARLRD
jgi:16S rRNA A1518/A1519 N6-dimethyltransferase RsmA/KsgA/DIM1 with predicted DNA glycosylase/AP lyase activity